MSAEDLSDYFFTKFADACTDLEIDPFDLIRVLFAESGCRADAHNKHGNASGIFQAMPATLMGLGWTKGHEEFRALDAAEQVPWMARYYRPYANWCGSDALCYVATFLPALGPRAAGVGGEYVLCGMGGPLEWAYLANRILDRDGNGNITVNDLAKQLATQCRGPRWEAILLRLRQTMGLQPAVPGSPDTQPEIEDPDSEPTVIAHVSPSVYLNNEEPEPDDKV